MPFEPWIGTFGGPGHDGGYLTDSIQVMTFDPKAGTVTLISIPRDLFEAAMMDGASYPRMFRSIALPLALLAAATSADPINAVALALQTGDLFFSDLANQVGNAGSELLYFLARQPGGADRATLAAALSAPLDATLDLLLRRDIIELVDGQYRFQVELIRRWFVQFDRVPALEERAVA